MAAVNKFSTKETGVRSTVTVMWFWSNMDPHLMTTLFVQPPCYYDQVKITESFYYFEDPIHATTLLLRPGFNGPTVVALTGFHCK